MLAVTTINKDKFVVCTFNELGGNLQHGTEQEILIARLGRIQLVIYPRVKYVKIKVELTK